MRKAIGKMLGSRKFLGALAGLVGALVARLGLEGVIGAEQAMTAAELVAGLAAAYVLGQGAADLGKEAAPNEIARERSSSRLNGIGFFLVCALACSLSACVSAAVQDKVATEVAIHDGYVRIIESGAAKPADLAKMLRASRLAWYAVDESVNGGAGAPLDEAGVEEAKP